MKTAENQIEKKRPGLGHPFEIESLRKSKAPDGAQGSDWYRYVIIQNTNHIVGYRQGRLQEVTEAVEELVVNLNQRRNGKKGRVHLTSLKKK